MAPAGPLSCDVQLLLGFVLLFAGGLGIAALMAFSPSRLLLRVEKQLPPETRARLAQELDEAERYLPATAMLQILGLALALTGGVTSARGGGVWPDGPLGVAVLLVTLPLFAAVLPIQIAKVRADALVYRGLPVFRGLRLTFLPLTFVLEGISRFLVRNVLGIRRDHGPQARDQLADEIRAAVEDSDADEALAEEEKEWIENIVGFRDEDVAGVMTPRTEIVGIEARRTLAEALALAVEAGHSRLPVFEERLDKVVGIFYLRDAVPLLIGGDEQALRSPVSEHMRPALFVPESKKLGDLLAEFRKKRLQIAIVLDEYGGTAGLICLEDLLEEIVGEIEDEYDPEREEPVRVGEGGCVAEVDARVKVDELNEVLAVELPESEDYETIGGFVFSHLGRIPQVGERFTCDGCEFTILEADERRVGRVKVRVLPKREIESRA